MKKYDIVKYFGIVVLIYALIFQSLIQKYIDLFRYFDEILALITIPIILKTLFINDNAKIKRYDLIIVCMLVLLFFVGIYSNLMYKYQPLIIALYDVILVNKFFLVYYLGNIINRDGFIEKYKNKIAMHIKFIILLLFALTIAHYTIGIFPTTEVRYNINVNELFFGHPTGLASTCVFLLGMVIILDKKVNTKFVYMIIAMLFSTLRMKAIAFSIVFIVMTIYISKSNKKITFSKTAILGIICALVAYERINYYFFSLDSTRAVLLNTSFKIAKDYFPFGTGFATYASYFSSVNYSPIYSLYKIRVTTSFISDCFWPMILGQFGILGTILYLICLFFVFRKIQANFSIETKYQYISKLAILGYLLIASTAESAFVNPNAISLAFLIGL